MSTKKNFAVVEPDSDDVDDGDYGTFGDEELLPSQEKGVNICGRKVSSLSLIIMGGVIFAGVITVALLITIAVGWNDNMKPKTFARAAVASDSGQCSEVGFSILKKKGSAVDAAIGTLTCIGVVRFQSAGIGGGGFMVIRNATSSDVEVIDYQGVAPAKSTQDMFEGSESAMLRGGKSIAVPGQMRGFALAHQRHGRLSWKDVLTPSIDLAKNGFKLESATVRWASRLFDEVVQNEHLSDLLINDDGTLKPAGTLVKRPELAATLQLIADYGADIFYNKSKISLDIVKKVKDADGVLTLDDLSSYKAKLRPAVSTVLNNRQYYTAPPPASGACVLSMLNILSGYGNMDEDILSYHRIIESFKYAFAQRTRLGDPDFVSSVDSDVKKMISLSEAESIRRNISDLKTYSVNHYNPSFAVQTTLGTTHLSIVHDKEEAVSVTESIGRSFGSMVTASGILLNDAMSDFSVLGIASVSKLPPSEANFIMPRKRPLSSSSPMIVVEETANGSHIVRSALGAGGNTAIPTTVLQVLIDLFDKNLTIAAAIAKKRIHDQLEPVHVDAEAGFSSDIIEGLRELGHNVSMSHGVLGHATAVYQSDTGELYAASDPRNDGQASYGAVAQ